MQVPLPGRSTALRALACAAALLLPACDGDHAPDAAAPQARPAEPALTEAAPEEDPFDALASCPEGDAPWSRAVRHAMRERELPRLGEMAKELAAAHPDRWEPVWAAGESSYRQGDLDDALPRYEAALALARSAGSPAGVSLAGYRLGWIAYRQGRNDDAEPLLREAVAAARDEGRNDLAAQALNGLAGLLLATGRLGAAQRALKDAGAALAASGMRDQARRIETNRAVVLMFLGDARAAREVLEPVYESAVADGDAHTAPRAALTLGNLYRRLDEPERAAEWYARVPEENAELVALARLSLGRIALARDDFPEARRWLELAAEHTTPGDRLHVRAFLAAAELGEGRAEEALARLERVIEDTDRAGSDEAGWIARRFEARAARALGDDALALRRLREAVEILERDSATLNPFHDGMRFLRERTDPYVELAATLAESGNLAGPVASLDDAPQLAEILRTVERLHSRALRRALVLNASSAPDDAPPLADLRELQSRLADDELLLDYAIGRDVGIVVALRHDRAWAGTLPGWRALDESFHGYRSALLRPLRSAEARLHPASDLRRSLHHGERLAAALLGPVASMMDDARRIYLVPDPRLALIPLGALPLPAAPGAKTDGYPRFLGAAYETAVLPLAGVPARERAPVAPLLLAGDPLPDASGEFPPLPLAAAELAGLRELWGDARTTRLSGAAFTPAAVTALDLASFGTIHLATHAVASTTDPERCAVYLSGGTRLGLDRIAALELGSPLVVLSACRTGEGELIPGEGVVGLGWAFLRAGARAVAASLWSVEDASAMRLMLEFHRGLDRGADAPAALLAARREVAASTPHPAYWSPFVLLLRPT